MKATTTTYKTAKRYGFDFADFAENDFGFRFVEPKANDKVVAFDCVEFPGEFDSYQLIKITCDCGEEFADALSNDDCSSESITRCPSCGKWFDCEDWTAVLK